MLSDLRGHVELLRYHRSDTLSRGQVDNGAHLGAKDTELHRPGEKIIEPRYRLHQADTVVLGFKPFVDLHKGDDAPLLPQESRNRHFTRLAVHRAFEKDRRDDLNS